MKASELPKVEGADFFFVRGAYRWGKGPTIADAIKAAQVKHLSVVHVCRCDAATSADSVDGSILYNIRGDIWDGRVWGQGRHAEICDAPDAPLQQGASMKAKKFLVKITIPGCEGSITIPVKATNHKSAKIRAEIDYFHKMVFAAQEQVDG